MRFEPNYAKWFASGVLRASRRLVAALENPDERNQWPALRDVPDQI
jgi:hypothetical protein